MRGGDRFGGKRCRHDGVESKVVDGGLLSRDEDGAARGLVSMAGSGFAVDDQAGIAAGDGISTVEGAARLVAHARDGGAAAVAVLRGFDDGAAVGGFVA